MKSIDFDLRHLEIFCKVLELKSFSKAAEAVLLTRPSVSERIATLETMVGAKLFDRLGRQIVPTAAGKLLYKHANLLLNMKKTACIELQSFLGIKQGKVHIGGSTIPGEYIFPKVLKNFHKRYPLISVTLTIADSSEIEKRILDGNLELGIIGAESFHKSLICRELWNDELVVAVPVGHKWFDNKKVSLASLSKEPFILRESGSGTMKIIEKYLPGSMAAEFPHTAARLGSSTAVKEGIKSGIGISILSSRALDTEIKAGILKILKIDDFSMQRKFYLIRDKRRNTSPLCRAMLDFLVSTQGNLEKL